MYLHPILKLKRTITPEKYNNEIVKKYDEAMKIINAPYSQPLTMDVFEGMGIYSLHDLVTYLGKNSEYGGYISLPDMPGYTLIPFHNDFMNKWLKFHNPRIIDFYDHIYEQRKNEFNSRHHFDMERFAIEEEFQLNNWRMPPLDKRMLDAPISGCWDKPELLAHYLTMKGYEVKRLSCNDGNVLRGHCFCVYFDGKCWSTATSYILDMKDPDFERFCKKLLNILHRVPMFVNPENCSIMAFEKPVDRCTAKEYTDMISQGQVIATLK